MLVASLRPSCLSAGVLTCKKKGVSNRGCGAGDCQRADLVSETLASALDSKPDLACGYQVGCCPSQWVGGTKEHVFHQVTALWGCGRQC